MLVFSLSSEPAFAGAWPVPKGKGLVISTSLYNKANKAYDENGKLNLDVTFSKLEEGIYIEHGLRKNTTLILQSSVQDISYLEEIDFNSDIFNGNEKDYFGIGESYLGLRQLLWQGDKTVFSAQGGVLLASGGEAITDADLGLGATHFEARLLLGRSFKISNKDGFVDLQIARRFRPGKFPSEWRMELSSGLKFSKKTMFMLQGFYTEGEGALGLARDNSRLKIQPSFVYDKSSKTSWQAGVYQTVRGHNIIREQAVFIGIWKRY